MTKQVIHNLGYPRVGPQRELKTALEQFWRGDSDAQSLRQTADTIRAARWQDQADAGVDLIPVNEFSLYDHMLDMSLLLGVVSPRFGDSASQDELTLFFRMARGDTDQPACEMTKWFDTNYHYLVPEFEPQQNFCIFSQKLFDEVKAAQAAGHSPKPVLVGPVSYLYLGKLRGEGDKLQLLEKLLPIYNDILDKLAGLGVDWVQLDEPCLGLDLDRNWQQAYDKAYNMLADCRVKILLANYFAGYGDNLELVKQLPVSGVHADAVRSHDEALQLAENWPEDKVLSLGVIDGRNIWRANLGQWLDELKPLKQEIDQQLWLAPSCSLLHTPIDLDNETSLDDELRSWLAFAKQKLNELGVLKQALSEGRRSVSFSLRDNMQAHAAREASERVHRADVIQRLQAITNKMTQRQSAFSKRSLAQVKALGLPLLPTTTIGSFPQTSAIRKARADFKHARSNETTYREAMQAEIKNVIERQDALSLDVLVHGEPERNDMVEYFGELLEGMITTQNGWVQSYGSRCVKPPIIFGDVHRPQAMTTNWINYAQSLTQRPVKGMLTGPVTILQWSFVRDDQPRSETCKQIALAIRDEVNDLESNGIKVIQVDEPALREGLPLKQAEQGAYLDWAVQSFKLATAGVEDSTQIHTHMCYAEFEDILEAITDMDADVITLENARSDSELLQSFEDFSYPNAIGPGVWDIHSPRTVPLIEMTDLLEQALKVVPAERLWVNPDCGLKTRGWDEIETNLENLVAAAKQLRELLMTDNSKTGTQATQVDKQAVTIRIHK
ncbi:MAG: 5-methyltetrahydropteroyltriglutamate--homocysteine S-methyltransferase [Gammaproteobacteria bacterium]